MMNFYDNLRVAALTPEQMPRHGDYLYVVTSGARSLTAFRTRFALDGWLKQHDLTVEGVIPPEGEHASFKVTPGYYECSHLDTHAFRKILNETPSDRRIRHLSNGEYTQGLLGRHESGQVIVHYLNPNCNRVVYNYRESTDILNGKKISDPFEQFLQDKQLFRVQVDSRKFTFEAYGFTEAHALDRLKEGLHKHADQNGLMNDWVAEMMADVSVMPITMGDCFRDREILTSEESPVLRMHMSMRG